MRTLDNRLCLAILVLIAGCNQPKLDDETVEKIRKEPGIKPDCVSKVQYGGLEAWPATQDCYEMTMPRRWKGVWRDYFEGQQFLPKLPNSRSLDRSVNIWIYFSQGVRPIPPTPTRRSYTIDFVGRRTVHRGDFGYHGMWEHEMIVDKVLSLKPLGATDLAGADGH